MPDPDSSTHTAMSAILPVLLMIAIREDWLDNEEHPVAKALELQLACLKSVLSCQSKREQRYKRRRPEQPGLPL